VSFPSYRSGGPWGHVTAKVEQRGSHSKTFENRTKQFGQGQFRLTLDRPVSPPGSERQRVDEGAGQIIPHGFWSMGAHGWGHLHKTRSSSRLLVDRSPQEGKARKRKVKCNMWCHTRSQRQWEKKTARKKKKPQNAIGKALTVIKRVGKQSTFHEGDTP